MRKGYLLFAIRICSTCFLLLFLLNPLARGNELMKLDLDDASSLGTTVSRDPKVKQEGNGSINKDLNFVANDHLFGRSSRA